MLNYYFVSSIFESYFNSDSTTETFSPTVISLLLELTTTKDERKEWNYINKEPSVT